jgi:phosphoglycerate dehydrogenase-like enzyme
MRVAVLDDYQDVAAGFGDWASLGSDIEVSFFRDHRHEDDAVVERLAPFEAVVAMRERTPFTRERLARLPNLELLITTGMGNAAFDLDAAVEHGVTVCGTGGKDWPTADLAWGLVLSLARSIPAEDAAMRAGRFQTTVGLDLAGATLGLVGLGRLGGRMARYAAAFDMRVIAWSENLTAARAAEAGAAAMPSLAALLAEADVVSIHTRLSARTRGLIGAAELARMKPTAYLVNTSRGPIVDEAALVAALRDGTIAGAGLDVFDTEPLDAGSPLLQAPNTVLTPHLGYVSRDTYAVFYADAVEDVAAFRAGAPVRVIAAP